MKVTITTTTRTKVYTEKIGLRVSPQMKLALEKEAKRRGMRITDVIRYAIMSLNIDVGEEDETIVTDVKTHIDEDYKAK